MRFSLITILAVLSAGMCFASPIVLPLAKTHPVIDGVIGEREYDEGVRFCGFLKTSSEERLADFGEGTATFLSDGKALFVAWRVKARNVDFDGGLRTAVTRRDGPVWDDDALELVIVGDDPDRIAHFAFNALGTVYDSLSQRDAKADPSWNCEGIAVGGRVNRGWWEFEVSVPLGSIGTFTGGLKANAGRGGPGIGTMSVNAAYQHIQGPKVEFAWRRDAPAVHVESIGSPLEGVWAPIVAITSANPGARYRADVFVREGSVRQDAGRVRLAEGGTLQAGGKFSARFETRSRADHRMELTVRDAENGEIVFSENMCARRSPRGGDVPVTAGKDIPGIGEVQVFHYPGMNRVRVNVYPQPGKEPSALVAKIGGKEFPLKMMDGKRYTVLAETPSEPGKFALELGSVPICVLATKRWEWEGHALGTERVIVPPFKPISAKGSVADVILRSYRFGGTGLPESIESLGREMLAAPVYFEAVVDGKPVVFVGQAPEKARLSVAADGYDAELAGKAFADGITIFAKGKLEYDGFLYGTCALSGAEGKNVERLTLVVPMQDAEVPLMHICMADSIRANPTGRVPNGEGVVWNGAELVRKAGPDWNMYEIQAVPYVWLGAEKRGLGWFVNNTCGMKLDTRKSAVRIRREKGVLNLEVDIINVPSKLKDGHSFEFGFEATPVKTPDTALRAHFQTGPGECPEGMVSRQAVNFAAVGFWNGWARRPYGNDWRLFDAAMKLVSSGSKTDAAEYASLSEEIFASHEKALGAYCKPLPEIGDTPHFDWFKSCRGETVKMLLRPGERVYPFKYSDPTLCWSEEAEQRHFNSEWVSRQNGYTAASRNFPTKSYLDYIIYYYAKEIQKGLVGIYFDDMFPMTARNPDICCKTDVEGRSHGNFGILEMRDLVKRTAVVQHLAGARPRLLQVHMTNCLLVPCFAFATSQLSWEDHFGDTEFQKRFSDDYVRAESLGGQIGAEAVALDGIKPRAMSWKDPAWDARFRFLTRTQQAMLLPAGVKLWLRPPWPPASGVHKEELFDLMSTPGRFGAWEADCEFTPYYEYDGSLGDVPAAVHVGIWRRKGKLLAVLGNQSGVDVAITFDGQRLTVPAYDLKFYEKR